MEETRLQLSVVKGARVKGMTSVPFPPTKEQLDKAFETLSAQSGGLDDPDQKEKLERATGKRLGRGLLS